MRRFFAIVLISLLISPAFVYSQKEKVFFTDVNIHNVMFKDKKNQNSICLFCHHVTQTSDTSLSGKKEYMNAPVNDLCTGCHGKDPHPGAALHLRKPTDEMVKKIDAWEKKNEMKLRFSEKGEVTCSTCHSPHPAGVLESLDSTKYKDASKYIADYSDKKSSKVSEENEKRIKRLKFKIEEQDMKWNVKLPLRYEMKEGKLCLVCHELD